MHSIIEKDGWRILQMVGDSTFEPEQFKQGEIVVQRGNRAVYRLELPQVGTVYAKWLFLQKISVMKRLLYRFKGMFRGVRVEHIFNIHEQLLSAGFGCAEPVLAAWHNASHTELFVCREVSTPPLSVLFKKADDIQVRKLLCLAATNMRDLHKAGFVHGDAIAGNICVDAQAERVYYLDNDRTQHYSSIHLNQCLRNVIQFCAHLPGWCELPDAGEIFVNEYALGFLSDEQVSSLKLRIEARIKQLAEENRIISQNTQK